MLNVFKKGSQMTDKVVMYFVYLALSIALTVWVGRTLSRNGKVFLEDAFADERLAGSVNHLLVVGFYLLNLGYVSVAMRDSDNISDSSIVMEQLSRKVGLVLLVLGVIHFFNLYALSRVFRHCRRPQSSARRRRQRSTTTNDPARRADRARLRGSRGSRSLASGHQPHRALRCELPHLSLGAAMARESAAGRTAGVCAGWVGRGRGTLPRARPGGDAA